MRYLRRFLSTAILIGAVSLAAADHVRAQAPAPAPAAPSNTVVQSRSLYTEWVVVVLLIAGAVFAVCRSSRRT